MKMAAYISVTIIFILQCSFFGSCFQPVTSFGVGLATVGSLFSTYYDAIRCRIGSCCNDRWIKKDIDGLQQDLARKLHGQHLVQKTVVGHVKGHLRTKDPPKALVLSFHGLTGVGKNYVSRIIAENVYKDGLHSPFVHLISATKEFPHEGMVPFYKDQLKSWIEGNVTKCEQSMFIIDEVDKIPALLLDVIKPYLDYYEHLGGVNYRKAIFVFLSNTGGSDIGHILLEHWRGGKKREALALSDVESSVMKSALNTETHSGLWHSQLISTHLITAYIPFLPLEKEHVRKCIQDALLAKGFYKDNRKIPQTIVDKVIKELEFYPASEQIFSVTGCKRVSQKVDYVMMDEPTDNHDREEL